MRRPLIVSGVAAILPTLLLFAIKGGGDVGAQPATPAGDRFSVTGFLTAGPFGPFNEVGEPVAKAIFVPGVAVRLENMLTGASSQPVRTDLSGRFKFLPQDPGRYRACWRALGFVSACSKIFSVDREHVHLGPMGMSIQSAPGMDTVFGTVRFADGSVPRTLEPLANVNAFAEVRALSGGSLLVPAVFVNNYGDYVIPRVPLESATLEARIEGAVESVAIGQPMLSPTGPFRIDFTLKNRPPEIQGLVGESPAGGHWTAAPGDLVKVTARATDPDGDPLEYRWLLPDGSSVLHVDAGETISYQVPDRPGRYEFTAVVYDGKGGYTKESVAITTAGVRFAGTVMATDAPVVPGAEVEISGKTTTTDGSGRFQLVVDESERYVLNIRARGYGLVSKIYDGGLIGGSWTLTRASVDFIENPRTTVIDVTNTRRPPDCPGALSDRTRQQERERDCGPGIRIVISPDSLVDAAGNPPMGPVEVELTTVDLRTPDAMPGDYTAVNQAGETRVMESYGAGTIAIIGGGQSYNLRPGASAEVIIPIDPAQLAVAAAIPSAIPLLAYDEAAGRWVELPDGPATRVGNAYVGRVGHFSAINADELKVNQACLRLESVLMPPEFELEVRIPSATGGADKVITPHIENSVRRFHVIYNLPTLPTPTGGALQIRAFENGTTTPIDFLAPPPNPPTPVITITSLGTQNPTTPNLPEFPYAACQASVELSPARLPPATTNAFLHGLFSFQAVNLTELDRLSPGASGPFVNAAVTYYNTIDPKGSRGSLDEFKAKNGFPAGEVRAQYANSADLGFGRDMHCRKSGSDVACYVTNYGDRFTDDLQDLIDAATNFEPIATVGMEYSRIEDPAGDGTTFITKPDGSDLRVVKFYVYKETLDADPATPVLEPNGRAPSANLDGFGDRPVPQLCMVCHGGRYPSTPVFDPSDPTTANLGSNFIPFDVTGLTTPNTPAQQAKFKSLNLDIVGATDPPAAIQEVLDGMYAPGGTASSQNEGFVVPQWRGAVAPSGFDPVEQEEMYRRVIAPSCRNCHITQAASGIAWDRADVFRSFSSSTAPRVCTDHEMPHALVTHNRFWLSVGPHQPLLFHDFLNGANPPGVGDGSDCVQ